MNVFESFRLTWWQAALLKLCLISLGILVGATWSEAFRPWTVLLATTVALPGAYITHVWWKQ